MRLIEKYIIQDYDSIWQRIYLSDWFDPFYRLYHLPSRCKLYVEKFIYYGRAGARVPDFDANGSYDLMYLHIKRVRKFMDSGNTHLQWNTERTKGLKRKLYELEERLRRKYRGEEQEHRYTSEAMQSSANYRFLNSNFDEHDRRRISLARKKDNLISRQNDDRLHELIQKYINKFWD